MSLAISHCEETVRTSLVAVCCSKSETAVSRITGPGVPSGLTVGRPAFPVKRCAIPVSLNRVTGLPGGGSGKSGGKFRCCPFTSEIIATTPSLTSLFVTLITSLTSSFTHLAPLGSTPTWQSTYSCGLRNTNEKNSDPNFSNRVCFRVIFAIGVTTEKTLGARRKTARNTGSSLILRCINTSYIVWNPFPVKVSARICPSDHNWAEQAPFWNRLRLSSRNCLARKSPGMHCRLGAPRCTTIGPDGIHVKELIWRSEACGNPI